MLDKAIKIAKGEDVEKVGMSVSMPVTLKEQLVTLANVNNVSTNSLICSILKLVLDGEIETLSRFSSTLVPELERLELRKETLKRHIDEMGGVDEKIENEAIMLDELKSIENTISALTWVTI